MISRQFVEALDSIPLDTALVDYSDPRLKSVEIATLKEFVEFVSNKLKIDRSGGHGVFLRRPPSLSLTQNHIDIINGGNSFARSTITDYRVDFLLRKSSAGEVVVRSRRSYDWRMIDFVPNPNKTTRLVCIGTKPTEEVWGQIYTCGIIRSKDFVVFEEILSDPDLRILSGSKALAVPFI